MALLFLENIFQTYQRKQPIIHKQHDTQEHLGGGLTPRSRLQQGDRPLRSRQHPLRERMHSLCSHMLRVRNLLRLHSRRMPCRLALRE